MSSINEYSDRLRERTEQLAPDDAAYGYAHEHLSAALAKALERVAEVYDPDDELPGAPLLNVETCPDWALPWLAQTVGVVLPSGITAAQQRALIGEVAGWERGTRAAMEAAATAMLTGTKTVYFRERDPNAADPPYALDVVTLASETPNVAQLQAVLGVQKPAGLVMTVRTVPGYDWQQVKTDRASWNVVKSTYSTWERLVLNQPG